MPEVLLIDLVPLWVIFLGSVAIVLLSIWGGLVIARLTRRSGQSDDEGPIGSVIGATLGLLAFMLAFTFGIAIARRDVKRDLLLDEVNSIGTTYLRTDLIPEPHRTDVRTLIGRYVDIRVNLAGHPEGLKGAIEESKTIQRQLWSHAAALGDEPLVNPDIVALFIESLNQTIDLQTKRVTVLNYRIPGVIWIVLGVITVLSMAAVGYQFGQKGRFNWAINITLAMSFSGVIVLITDLDRVTSGWLRISNQPIVELRADLRDR